MNAKPIYLLLTLTFIATSAFCRSVDLWPGVGKVTTMTDYFQAPANQWLTEHRHWHQYVDKSQMPLPLTNFLGAFGIGNGYAFTIMGMSYPLNGTHNTTGVNYQCPGNFFGGTDINVRQNAQKISFDEEWLWSIRKTAIVVTKAKSANLELYTINFGPLNMSALLHAVIIKNTSSSTQGIIEAEVSAMGQTDSDSLYLYQYRKDRIMSVGFLKGARSTSGNASRVFIGNLQPGEERIVLCFQAFTRTLTERDTLLQEIDTRGWETLLRECRDFWVDWRDKFASIDCPDPMVEDYWDLILVTNKVQQDSQGGISPMSRYTKSFIRDDFAAVLLFLRGGWYEDVKDTMDYYYKACRVNGSMNNSIGLDYDISNLPPEPDWASIDIMGGRNRAEAPSYIPIKYWQYYKHTGDLQYLRDHYEFIKRSVTGQEVTSDYYLKASGDEPWRWVFFIATGLYEPENLMWSTYSSFMYVAAAEAVADIASVLGESADEAFFRQEAQYVRDATENDLWHPDGFYSPGKLFADGNLVAQPFEDINTMNMWIGYSEPSDPRAQQNLDITIDRLLRPDGTIQSPAFEEAYDGMLPGQFLQNLALTDHPLAEKAFNALPLVLQDTGETGEGHWHDDHSVWTLVFDRTGQNGDITARFRPWEGGCNAEGMMIYLTGLETDVTQGEVRWFPHLPNNWPGFEMLNNRIGDTWYDFEVEDIAGSTPYRRYLIESHTGTTDFNAVLTASFDGRVVTDIKIDGVSIVPSSWQITNWYGRQQVSIDSVNVPAGATVKVDFYHGVAPTATPTDTPVPTITPTPTNTVPWTATPIPTDTPVPTATFEPTSTPGDADLKVYLAGYFSTAISSSQGGVLTMWAYVPEQMGTVAEKVEVFHNHLPMGIFLTAATAGEEIFELSMQLGAGLPQGTMLFELAPVTRGIYDVKWPYLKVQ